MTKTIEERRETARRNGAMSRGPVSATGKAISSRNSVKLGIYCRTIALPDEDPTLIAALRQDWYDFITPTTPVSRRLLEDIIFSDLMNERTKRAIQQAIAGQGQAALASWNEQRRLVAESWAAALGTHTLEASHALR